MPNFFNERGVYVPPEIPLEDEEVRDDPLRKHLRLDEIPDKNLNPEEILIAKEEGLNNEDIKPDLDPREVEKARGEIESSRAARKKIEESGATIVSSPESIGMRKEKYVDSGFLRREGVDDRNRAKAKKPFYKDERKSASMF